MSSTKVTIGEKVIGLQDELVKQAKANGWNVYGQRGGANTLRFQKRINGSVSDLRVTFRITGDIRQAEFDGSVLPQLVLEDLVLAILS